MPIVAVHGVNVRDVDFSPQIDAFLRRYVAPVISDDPDAVSIIRAYWGDVTSRLAWEGMSRPRGPLLGMGAAGQAGVVERAVTVTDLSEALDGLPADGSGAGPGPGRLAPAGPGGAPLPGAAGATAVRLKDLPPDDLADLAVTALGSLPAADQNQRALAALAADDVAYDPATPARLAACPDRNAELVLLQQLVVERYNEEQRAAGGLAAQGAPAWLQRLGDRIGEGLDRAGRAPGYAASRVVAEARGPLNDFVTRFMGDVMSYLDDRGTAKAPGPIPKRVLKALAAAAEEGRRRDGEPLIVLSHSMGGQVVYDVVTHFLPKLRAYAGVRIDFWCAAASQVGLFEELKLFPASRPEYCIARGTQVPLPDPKYLGGWWNVWDYNDFISWSARGIFDGVDDGPYDSGLSLLHAHGGYLERPSFFRALAGKLKAARAQDWGRP